MKSRLIPVVFSVTLAALAAVVLCTTSIDAHAATVAISAATLDPSAFVLIGIGSIQALREQRAEKAKEARALLDNHPADKKLPEDVEKKVDALYADIEALDGRIGREQKLLDLSAEKTFKDLGVTIDDAGNKAAAKAVKAAYAKALRLGPDRLSDEECAIVRNTMSTTTNSEGGYTVTSQVARELIESLKDFGGMRVTSEVFRTEKGNPLSYPSTDGTSEVGELVAENATANDADISFGTVALNVFKYGSKVVTVPIELLMDSEIDVERLVNGRLAQRLGRITNQHYTTGTGSSQPRGIVTGSSLGKTGAAGQVTTIVYDDVVDLFHSVDPAYRRAVGAGFMTSDSGLKMLRKVKDSNSRPIFVPGYETGVPGGAPDTLLGAKLFVNNDIAVPAASAKSLIYGDLKQYKIRDALEFSLFRFTDSAFTKKGQVGFLAWMRSGGNLVDTSAVKHYAHPAS